jgi:hypothetical protein
MAAASTPTPVTFYRAMSGALGLSPATDAAVEIVGVGSVPRRVRRYRPRCRERERRSRGTGRTGRRASRYAASGARRPSPGIDVVCFLVAAPRLELARRCGTSSQAITRPATAGSGCAPTLLITARWRSRSLTSPRTGRRWPKPSRAGLPLSWRTRSWTQVVALRPCTRWQSGACTRRVVPLHPSRCCTSSRRMLVHHQFGRSRASGRSRAFESST